MTARKQKGVVADKAREVPIRIFRPHLILLHNKNRLLERVEKGADKNRLSRGVVQRQKEAMFVFNM